jgi:hypothetical protein
VDVSSLISSAVYTQQSSTANERQIAVAANAMKKEQETVSVLLEAIQQSASYGSGGQPAAGGTVGTRFSATA